MQMLHPETITIICDADERSNWTLQAPAGQLWERLAEQEIIPTARLGAALIRADVRGEAL
ncbi:MAG: hypothetical protein BGO91_13625 [Leifsonia sp. 71-9]|nr:MAG: hypothetical protein BGO91_13625 [Leifsonia sp. 71-9]